MSNHHISDDLPRLLTGDATRDVVLDAAAHLRTCADCQQELVSAVVAHASLTSAHRFAPEIVSPEVEAVDAPDEPVQLPDLSAMFSQVRQEASAPSTTVTPLRRRRLLIGVAAAAVVVAGAATTVTLLSTGGSSGPSSRSVALHSIDGTQLRGTATMVGTNRMRIDATSLPKLDADHQYEVWLADNAGHRQPVGFIDHSSNRADLAVSASLTSRFDVIAVSKQSVGQVDYSGDTVLKGSYA